MRVGALWAGRAPAFDDIKKILDVGVAIHVGVRCTQAKRTSQLSKVIRIDVTVAIDIAPVEAVGDVVFAEM
jgi:hypothetical protein